MRSISFVTPGMSVAHLRMPAFHPGIRDALSDVADEHKYKHVFVHQRGAELR